MGNHYHLSRFKTGLNYLQIEYQHHRVTMPIEHETFPAIDVYRYFQEPDRDQACLELWKAYDLVDFCYQQLPSLHESVIALLLQLRLVKEIMYYIVEFFKLDENDYLLRYVLA